MPRELCRTERLRLLQEAVALVNPIAWPEPFGLVMAESLAVGTPVVASPCGAAPEIVTHGRTGFLSSTRESAVQALDDIDLIDRDECRAEAVRRFSLQRMAADYEALYAGVLAQPQPQPAMLPGQRLQQPDHPRTDRT